MPVNRWINNVTVAPEQDLLQDLWDESIAMYGIETYYIMRDAVDLDLLFGEDELASYTQAFPVEMYLKSSQSFAGQSDFISKFGLVIEDQATFTLSVRRFKQIISGKLTRPRENDILWVQLSPQNRYLFEIKFVEDKEQLFQLGKLYTYELRCELMNYTHERIKTQIPDIDDVATRDTYQITITMGAGAGVYQPGETVYQGASFVAANATGDVVSFNETTRLLTLQYISGEFGNTHPVIGVTSEASYVVASAANTTPTIGDPMADNQRISDESEDVIVIRGSNPRRS